MLAPRKYLSSVIGSTVQMWVWISARSLETNPSVLDTCGWLWPEVTKGVTVWECTVDLFCLEESRSEGTKFLKVHVFCNTALRKHRILKNVIWADARLLSSMIRLHAPEVLLRRNTQIHADKRSTCPDQRSHWSYAVVVRRQSMLTRPLGSVVTHPILPFPPPSLWSGTSLSRFTSWRHF